MSRFLVACIVLAALAIPVTYLLTDANGAVGMALGLGATSFNMLALWAVIRLTGTTDQARGKAARGAILTVVVFLLKLPVFIVSLMLAQRIGDPAPTCFLAGLALVYCSTVGWALARR